MKKEIEVKLKKANYELFADKNELTGVLAVSDAINKIKLTKNIN